MQSRPLRRETLPNKSSRVSMRMLMVVILVLSLVYIILHVQLHHRHHQHHHHPRKKDGRNSTSINRPEKDNKEPADEEGSSITVAVGFFPNAERESDESGNDLYSQNGGNNDANGGSEEDATAAAATVDWEDLYKRGILAAHSCRIHKNEPNVTFLQAPDFILAGVQKAGTTALFALLSFHPEIIASRHFEEHFFDMRYGGLMEELRWKQQHLAGKALSCATAQAYVERMDFAPLLARKMQQQQQQQQQLQPPQQQQQPQRFLTFEKTPNYIMWPHVPKAIVATCPWKPKIIIMLRDPVDRLYSHYQMHFVQDEGVASLEELLNRELKLLRHFGLSHAPNVPTPTTAISLSAAMFNNETTTMAMFQVPNITRRYRDEKDSINFRGFGNHGNYLRFLYRGMYYFQLDRWLEYFELGDNLLVIQYEQFKKDPQSVMQQVYKFVGTSTASSSFQLTRAQLTATYRPTIDQKNRKEMIPAQPLAPSTRRYLEHFYRPYNERLSDLLGEEWRGVWEHKEEEK